MAVGANIKYGGSKGVMRKVLALLGFKQTGRLGGVSDSHAKLCYKAGAPANNTAADNPNALYDILYDATNSRVYCCTAWTADASATTWTRIV